ncbi:hypothetical protein K431DRAFT_287205 [Polychaeton citri CBS 116435]|uniref:PH domain-containing protein n=1 Tax=Polychaeton citri CBS 116435 TaxID=1314669 RepID=A0A9P4Q1I6_9PEZI|nr:hypothetical protein K431DRAFT_287205 [Polychaeton citri CBS 116435]
MAAAVGKFAANHMLKKQMKNYSSKKPEGENDPYFAYIEDPRKPGKVKKVKKQIPAYIPEHDANILAAVRRRSYRLDMCLFNLFGIRFGWEAVIGLIPGFGDLVGVFFALMILRKCRQVEGGLDSGVQMRMLINIALDFIVGLVPFIGDLADAAFKCNTKNCRLLERTLEKKYGPDQGRRDDRLFGGDSETRKQKRKSGIYHPQDPPPATVFDLSSDDEEHLADDRYAREKPVREPKPSKSKYGSRREAPISQETGRVAR